MLYSVKYEIDMLTNWMQPMSLPIIWRLFVCISM